MTKLKKTVSLTHTPTTRIICIPNKVVKDMGIKNDKEVYIEYDYNTKVMIVKKNEE